MKKLVALLLVFPLCVISCEKSGQDSGSEQQPLDKETKEISSLLVGNKWVLANYVYDPHQADREHNYWGSFIYDFTSSNKVMCATALNNRKGYPMCDGLFCCNENDFIWDKESYEYELNDCFFSSSIPYGISGWNLEIVDKNKIHITNNPDYEYLIRFDGFNPDRLNRISAAERTEYTVTESKQTQEVLVKANMKFEVTVDASCSDWISYIETRGMPSVFPNDPPEDFYLTVILDIAKNTGKERTGKVKIGKGDVFCEITIKQTEEAPNPKPNQIIYKSIDGSKMDPYLFNMPEIVSNEYDGSYGIITFDSNLTYIHESLFYQCENLIFINIPEGVLSIDHRAFDRCRNLKEVVLPESLCSIAEMAFRDCVNLRAVYCKPIIPPLTEKFNGPYRHESPFGTLTTIYVPMASLDKYKEEWVENTIIGYNF